MNPRLLAQYSEGTMAKAAGEAYARKIAEDEMPAGLAKYVGEEVFPRFGFRVKGGVKPKTARRWMLKAGFTYQRYAKGVYVE